MTEEEAMTKWCPFARILDRSDVGAGINRPLTMLDADDSTLPTWQAAETRCIASGCMAWRRYLITGSGGACQESNDGFCGLAGHTGGHFK